MEKINHREVQEAIEAALKRLRGVTLPRDQYEALLSETICRVVRENLEKQLESK